MDSSPDGVGPSGTGGGDEGGSGVGVLGMNNLHARLARITADKTKINLLEFIPFSSSSE
jgi:hypothetical protein